MRKLIFRLLLPALVLLTGCNGKPADTNNDMLIVMQQTADESGLHRMQDSGSEQTITFRGRDYLSSVTRKADDELAIVTSQSGDRYVDNKITLHLKQKEGGKQVFAQTFTKQSFSSVVSTEFLKNAILEGMVFDKTTPQGFVYAASICYPYTDLYVPIAITITTDGKISMVKEELMEELYVSEEHETP